jgi:rare lipoprotein A
MGIDELWRNQSLAPIAFLGLVLAGCASGGGIGPYYHSGRPNGTGVGMYTVGSPYEMNGVWYYPAVDYDYDKTGIASWYGPDFDGKYTANGEIYDMNQLTAAHTTLPLPSIVEVTDLQNGRSLQLRVNDRGPFIDRRLIDVSRRAAQLLGFETQGTAPVRVRVLKEESIAAAEEAMRNGGELIAEAPVMAAPTPDPPARAGAPFAVADAAPVMAAPAPALPVARPPYAPAPEPEVLAGGSHTARMRPAATATSVDPGGPGGRIYIQAGAFSMRGNARRVQSRIARLGSVEVTTASVNGIELYRVRLGPVTSAAQADRLLARVVNSGYPEARIVGD